MQKTASAVIAGLIWAGSALAQTQPPAGQTPAPAPEETSTQTTTPPHASDRKKDGSESGWGGQQKTEEEQKADPKRNEAQGQPPS